jgi:exo-1,4-beta-D-glucosaminidase
VRRGVSWVIVGISAALVAIVVTIVLSQPGESQKAAIVVPQTENTDLTVRRQPTSELPVVPTETTTGVSTPSPTQPSPTERPRPPAARVTPTSTPPPSSVAPKLVDFQAEDAAFRHANVESNHAGFTGSGFVNFDNEAGSALEWTVNARATGAVNVVIRYANGSDTTRLMDLTVNGILTASPVAFPRTKDWEDWQTVTVRVSLLAGVNKIRTTSVSADGGPNIDKISI